MFVLILFYPLLAIVVLGGLMSLRTAGTTSSPAIMRRTLKYAGIAALLAAGSCTLMFGVAETWSKWAAVGMLALVIVPILAPVALIILGASIAKLTGEPMRWN